MDGDAEECAGEEGEAGEQGSVHQQDVSFVASRFRRKYEVEHCEATGEEGNGDGNGNGYRTWRAIANAGIYRFLRGDSVILVLLS